jgi:putative ABC transport system ATP-binding protein
VEDDHGLLRVALTEPLLRAKNLYRFFHVGDDEVLALRGVSLEVVPHELVAIVGPSGSGKSTLLSCLAGLDDPDAGEVRVAGERMSRRSEAQRAALRSRKIGVLFQSRNLVAHLDVSANHLLAQRVAGARSHAARRDEVLERVGLAHRAGARPAQLSGGETVRAGLAVALVNEPSVLLADEPTAEVDDATESALLRLLRDETRDGRAVVVVTHSERVAGVATRVVTLADGRLVG